MGQFWQMWLRNGRAGTYYTTSLRHESLLAKISRTTGEQARVVSTRQYRHHYRFIRRTRVTGLSFEETIKLTLTV